MAVTANDVQRAQLLPRLAVLAAPADRSGQWMAHATRSVLRFNFFLSLTAAVVVDVILLVSCCCYQSMLWVVVFLSLLLSLVCWWFVAMVVS